MHPDERFVEPVLSAESNRNLAHGRPTRQPYRHVRSFSTLKRQISLKQALITCCTKKCKSSDPGKGDQCQTKQSYADTQSEFRSPCKPLDYRGSRHRTSPSTRLTPNPPRPRPPQPPELGLTDAHAFARRSFTLPCKTYPQIFFDSDADDPLQFGNGTCLGINTVYADAVSSKGLVGPTLLAGTWRWLTSDRTGHKH
jgi:hypothetical protein